MTKEKENTYEFFYDEVGEKEILGQMTSAYQSGNDNTLEKENDPKVKALFENKAY